MKRARFWREWMSPLEASFASWTCPKRRAAVGARRRMAALLHDDIQQQLLVLRARLQASGSPADGSSAELVGEVDAIIQRVREIADTGRFQTLSDLGLTAALNSMGRRLPIVANITTAPDPLPRLPGPVEECVFLCISEAVTNVLKHAGATSVDVNAVLGPDGLKFSVTDDGSGAPRPAHVVQIGGVDHMRHQVAALGGRLWVASTDAGTAVRATVPVP